MIYINIQNKWEILIYLQGQQNESLYDALSEIGVSQKEINKAFDLYHSINKGFTYSNLRLQTSVVGISKTSSKSEFYDTITHEFKHVQSHICDYFDINEDSEEAAYLIGYIMRLFIHKIL